MWRVLSADEPSQGFPRPNGPRKGAQERGFPAKRCTRACLLMAKPVEPQQALGTAQYLLRRVLGARSD